MKNQSILHPRAVTRYETITPFHPLLSGNQVPCQGKRRTGEAQHRQLKGIISNIISQRTQRHEGLKVISESDSSFVVFLMSKKETIVGEAQLGYNAYFFVPWCSL